MMNPFEFIDSINDRITSYVSKMIEVLPEDIGLDGRAGYRFYVDKNHTCIAVSKSQDRTLQYYGGFEYVSKEYRSEVGNWVFYSSEDNRVAGHLRQFEQEQLVDRF